MKICIDGAGAMDGPLSRRIAERAPTSACSRAGRILPPRAQQALRLLTGDPAHVVRPRCADNPAELSGAGPRHYQSEGPFDCGRHWRQMQPLLGAHTRIVTA